MLRKFFIAELLVLILNLFAISAFANQAEDFNLDDLAGSKVTLSSLKGKIVYLDFWASWCGPCHKSFPWMNSMQSKYGSKNFEVVAINLDEKKEDALRFLKENPANFKILMDPKGSVAKLYDIKGMPSSFMIDSSGGVIFEHKGFNDADSLEIEKKIKAAIGSSK